MQTFYKWGRSGVGWGALRGRTVPHTRRDNCSHFSTAFGRAVGAPQPHPAGHLRACSPGPSASCQHVMPGGGSVASRLSSLRRREALCMVPACSGLAGAHPEKRSALKHSGDWGLAQGLHSEKGK